MGDTEPLIDAKGVNGQVRVFQDHITIARKGTLGFLTQGHKGEKSVFIRQISSVQFKDAGALTNGYIQFAFVGGQETKGGIMNATQDENSIMFNRGQRQAFAEVRDTLMSRIAALSAPAPSVAAPLSASSVADELTKLAALRDQGILSIDEFNAEKMRVLGRTA